MSVLDPTNDQNREDRKEATKTYLEQIKLLITLASTFIIAPAVLYKDLDGFESNNLIAMECLFIGSVFFGYVAVGTITGTQYKQEYNVYRTATTIFSLFQLVMYLIGLTIFIIGFLKQQSYNREKSHNVQKVKNTVEINYDDSIQILIIKKTANKPLKLPKDDSKLR